MIIRITKKTVKFTRPFTLNGTEEMLPAGAYLVETNEEPIESDSFLANRLVSMQLFVPGVPREGVRTRMLKIDPSQLDSALERDRMNTLQLINIDANHRTLTGPMKSGSEVADLQAVEQGENEGMAVR